jgi:ribosomal protein S27AE
MAAPTVIGALRRFLPGFLHRHPAQNRARRRAIWAISHCRTPAMGGHIHACGKCGTSQFAYHSCNHRACPQCGGGDTAQWVERELGKRVGAP